MMVLPPVTFTEVVWGKVLACELLVPVQVIAWVLLLMINGIAIENVGLILIHVSVTSFILILLGTLTAIHYRERTAAQFIFSTALVVVMLLGLALPDNPLNMLTWLAVGTAGMGQWIVLGVTIGSILVLGFVTHTYAEIIVKSHHIG